MLKQRGRVIGTGSLDVRDQVGNSDLGDDQVKTLCFQHDFDDLAGAQGAVTLTSRSDVAQTIPDNAVIVRSYVEGITSPTSGGSATIKVGITGDDDCFIATTASATNADSVFNLINITQGTVDTFTWSGADVMERDATVSLAVAASDQIAIQMVQEDGSTEFAGASLILEVTL